MLLKKKKKVIKRIYEQGVETLVLSAKKPKRKLLPRRKSIKQTVRIKQALAKLKPFEKSNLKSPLVDKYELPSHYGSNFLKLIIKDPFWIYAYWEIVPDSIESLKKNLDHEQIKEAKIVLRLYDITFVDFNGTNANSYFDIEVGYSTTNWYINLPYDNVSYVGEIGLRISDGRFFALVRSNFIHTPRMSYSPRTEQIWMKINNKDYDAPSVAIKNPPGETKAISASTENKKRKIYLTEEDLKRYYIELSPFLKDIISPRLGKMYGVVFQHSFIVEGEREEEKRKIMAMLPKDYFIKNILSIGSSQNLIILGASENLVKGPGGASEFVEGKIKPHKFFFELATEVIVYGRTEPDAELWLGDKKIKLQEDGTFSLRFALPPDGKLPLEFKAISHDREESRQVETHIERRTHFKK